MVTSHFLSDSLPWWYAGGGGSDDHEDNHGKLLHRQGKKDVWKEEGGGRGEEESGGRRTGEFLGRTVVHICSATTMYTSILRHHRYNEDCDQEAYALKRSTMTIVGSSPTLTMATYISGCRDGETDSEIKVKEKPANQTIHTERETIHIGMPLMLY